MSKLRITLKPEKPPEEQSVKINWKEVQVTATWSTNLFNDQISAARWVGAELSLKIDLEEVDSSERTDWINDIHERLIEICQEITENSANRFVKSKSGEGWRK